MNRLKMIWKAIWSSFLGKQEMKHHREILDLTYEQMVDGLADVNEDLAKVATAKHRIIGLEKKAHADTVRLDGDARRFLEAGDEPSARQVLDRKQIILQQAAGLTEKIAVINQRQNDLTANKAELETRIESFKAEKELIKARHSAAQATANIGRTVTGIGKDAREMTKAVGRINEATEQLEAEGDALGELLSTGALDDVFNPGQSPLERRGLELARDEATNKDLLEMKKQLGLPVGATSGELD